MSYSPNSEPIGRIVGKTLTNEFLFVSKKEEHPPKYEYVSIKSKEKVRDEIREVEVLAQVTEISSLSEVYSESYDMEHLERIHEAGIEDANVVCLARTLGYIDGNEILVPRRAIYPGNEVYLASDSLVEKFFSYPEEEGLKIGYLISRPRIPVNISVKGFRRHLAIIAQTGAGKSYAAGVLIEELLDKGATVIVLDPHGDYVFLGTSKDGSRYSKWDRIRVFRNPNSMGRYDQSMVGNLSEYVVKFSELSTEEICRICGIQERWTKIINAIETSMAEINEEKSDYTLDDLMEKLRERGDENSLNALRYLKRMEKLRVFGDYTTSIEELLKPMHVSVVDLSGLNDATMDFIAYKVLEGVYSKLLNGEFDYPVFVFVEEAHKLVPSKKSTMSSEIINTIATEGRKFGMFLVLITQRPSRINSESLSQCNSQIILRITNPVDQNAVRMASERMSEELLRDLPGLNVGEAIIVGEVTKVPVMVKIRERRTMEGGADIDIVSKLRDARDEVRQERGHEEFIRPSKMFSEV